MEREAIELHDSVLARVEHDGSETRFFFEPAYLHRSPGEPGLDSGTGWSVGALLSIVNSTESSLVNGLPARVSDGTITADGVTYQNVVPVPLSATSEIKLTIELETGSVISFSGSRAAFRTNGDYEFVENVPAIRPLMGQNVRVTSSSTDRWVWLFPLAYALHVAEEYAFHFPAYVASLTGRSISNPQFLVINTVFWLLMAAAVVLVLARPSHAWLIVTLAAVLGINAALHIVTSIVSLTYSPGTVTAAFLYVPLVVFALRRILPRVRRRVAVRAAALGAAIHAGVILLAANASLIPSP